MKGRCFHQCLISSGVSVFVCVLCHLHVCRALAFCADTQHVTASDPGPWKYLFTERWYLGVGEGLSCTESQRVAGREEMGGRGEG